LIFVSSLGLLSAACASAELSVQNNPATLEVENRTHEDLDLSVRGRFEAKLRPGKRARVRLLAPGSAHVTAHVASGERTLRAEATLALTAGAISRWSVLPTDGEPTPAPPAFGTLVVRNPSSQHLSIRLDGRLRGRIFAGEERRFEDLPAGLISLEARPEDGSPPVRVELPLPDDAGGQLGEWTYAPTGVPLEVVNGTDEALVFAVDGVERGRIEIGGVFRSVEPRGLKVLTARSLPSRRLYESVIELSEGTEERWQIARGASALVIENRTGERIEVTGALEPLVLEPRARARREGLTTGSFALSARGASGLVYPGEVELRAGQTVTWVVDGLLGSVRVENQTSREVTLFAAEGDGPELIRGEVPRHGVALVKQLRRGPVALRAIANPTSLGAAHESVDRGRVHTTRLDLGEQFAATWVITETSGAVHVKNRREEAVEVFIDATRVGLIEAGSSRTFTGIPAGMRLVETLGARSGVHRSTPLGVAEDGLATHEVIDVSAFVEVINGTGEAIAPEGALAEQVATLEDGVTHRFRLGAGTNRLVFVGRDTGFAYGTALELEAGETARWTARVAPGTLLLWSRLAETVAVTVDEMARGSLAPDASLTLTELAPGRHRVATVGLRTGRFLSREVFVPPGDTRKLTLSSEQAVVLVENLAKEPVTVSIDGELYGVVGPERVQAFGKVAPGAREVTLEHVRSHRVQRVALDLREGQSARVVAAAPRGVLVVENTARCEVRVRVDGVAIATLASDAGPTLLTVPSGPRRISLERIGEGASHALTYAIDITADHATHLPVPPRDVRLVVVNRSEVELALFAGEKALGTVAPRTSLMLEHVATGDVELTARVADRITHSERRQLRAGETATWVLDAEPARPDDPAAPEPPSGSPAPL
jgi:hypothetical protein